MLRYVNTTTTTTGATVTTTNKSVAPGVSQLADMLDIVQSDVERSKSSVEASAKTSLSSSSSSLSALASEGTVGMVKVAAALAGR